MVPTSFLQRMKPLLGSDYPAFLAALDRPLARGLRLNPQKADPARFSSLPFLGPPVPWAPGGYYLADAPGIQPGKHPYHEAGLYYLQEPSAMAPAALLAPQPGERVLDLCAAPGGKATQLSAYLGGQGLLVCNEISPKRAKILSRNIERMGIPNALVLNMHPEALAARLPGFFDRVLVDAPCSGEGMFRKEAAAGADWSPETVAMCAGRQLEILTSAAELVRPGGTLVYSTCTFAPEEDEGSVSRFLSRRPDFSLVDAPAPWFSPGRPDWIEQPAEGLSRTFRLWPHLLRGEGHFAAVLRRDGDAAATTLPAPPRADLPPEALAFLGSLDISLPAGLPLFFGDTLYLAPPDLPDLAGLKVLRPGLELGRARKGRFEPAHALALFLKTAASTADFPADAPETAAYLRGEVLPGQQIGWTLITVDHLSLGWAKGSQGQLKNHFPKGLRWL